MKFFLQSFANLKKTALLIILFLMMSISSSSYAGIDTTLFRINAIQDSVYVGDTVDLDIYIGDPKFLFVLNTMKEFKLEIATDSSLIIQDDVQFEWDILSLTNFFSTTFSNLITIANVDPLLGKLLMNCRTNTINLGQGNARAGRSKYIVQDNVAGRQMMPFRFDTAISKDLLGFNNPVKLIVDSVLIIGKKDQIPTVIKNSKNTSIRISPNPVVDFVHIDGAKIQQYKLMSIVGNEIISESKSSSENLQLDVRGLHSGTYILMMQTDGIWNNYKIVKK